VLLAPRPSSSHTANGIGHIKWGAIRGGFVRNVTFRGILATGPLTRGIFLDGYYGHANPSCPEGWLPPSLPTVDGVLFDGIDATQSTVKTAVDTFHLEGLPGAPITNLVLRDVAFADDSGGRDDWTCTEVDGTAQKGTVTPWPPCLGVRVVQ